MENSAIAKPQLFLSIKWKVMLTLSLVLLAINGSFTYLSYLYLHQQYEESRRAAHEHHRKLVVGLVQQSAQSMQQFASMIPRLNDLQDAMKSGDMTRTQTVFDPLWATLQLDIGIEEVRVYGESGQLLSSWGNEAGTKNGVHQIDRQLAENSKKRERPQTFLGCFTQCKQYAAVPVLARGEYIGTILIGASLADVVLAFKKLADADIGLLTSNTAAPAGEYNLPGWHSRLLALSGLQRNFETLRRASQQDSDASAGAITLYRVSHRQRDFEVVRFPIQATIPDGYGEWVMIFDVTDALAAIHHATWNGVTAGLIGLIVSELLLLLLLWMSMNRLKRTAQTIPLLGQGAFEQVRTILRKGKRNHTYNDEIDVLDQVAVELANRLEGLQGEVALQTKVLNQLIEELSREKDFVSSILDTAQVIVVAQNKKGEITMINRYGLRLCGYIQQELMGKNFTTTLFADDIPVNLVKELAQFLASEYGHLRNEASLKCKDGSLRNVIWVHSHLTQHLPGDPVMLSVGLDITERRKAEQRLSYLADYDALTGLYNRHRFQDELKDLLAIIEREGQGGALLSFDIDEFKYVNDTMGHQAGDELLKIVGQELMTLPHPSMLAARLGADEFAVAVKQVGPDEAIKLAHTLIQRIGELELPTLERSHKISISVGIVLFSEHGNSAQDLLTNVDLALFRARQKGRGSWHMFSPEQQLMERVQHRVHWVEKIEHALAEDNFVLHYQPILSLREDSVSHYEALVRMREADGSLIPPGAFIGVAEATGLIRSIDRMVLRKAIARLVELERNGMQVKLSVNLSGRSFEDPSLVETLKQEVQRGSFDPANLIFEITETAAVADIQAARAVMLNVQEIGCAFSLDDFGVGFSSFNYLKQLPVDYVKIDGSFIQHLPENPDDQVFVRVLVEAARGFGKLTVAEFVENAETLVLLREYGVDFAQGFYIGKPDPQLHLSKIPARQA